VVYVFFIMIVRQNSPLGLLLPLDYCLVMVGELACLSDPESYTVGGFPPSRSNLDGQVKG